MRLERLIRSDTYYGRHATCVHIYRYGMSIILKENIKSTAYARAISPFLVRVKSSRRLSFGEVIH